MPVIVLIAAAGEKSAFQDRPGSTISEDDEHKHHGAGFL
jgi:hypothetical protein